MRSHSFPPCCNHRSLYLMQCLVTTFELEVGRTSSTEDYAESICTLQDTQTADSFSTREIPCLFSENAQGDGHLTNTVKGVRVLACKWVRGQRNKMDSPSSKHTNHLLPHGANPTNDHPHSLSRAPGQRNPTQTGKNIFYIRPCAPIFQPTPFDGFP